MKTPVLTACVLFIIATSLRAASNSENYSIITANIDAGGAQTTSASYTQIGSAGGIAGISSALDETLKSGYIGQLYDITGIELLADTLTVAEDSTRQLNAQANLDDDTLLTLNATDVIWSVQNGPLSGIDPSGLAHATNVYENTPATAQGIYGEDTALLELTVLDTITDNYGSYAGDGLGDDWQMQHFGENNPNAAPSEDPDADGQDNEFEWVAGLIPTNQLSRFLLAITSVPGQPEQQAITFSPRFNDRSYVVKFCENLTTESWTLLPDGIINDNGENRTVIDPAATQPVKFYQVEIGIP